MDVRTLAPRRIASVADLLDVLNPSQHNALAGLPITGYAVDSRMVQPGQVFVAIPGAHQDGHNFVAAALQAGASACLVQRKESLEQHQHCILTDNSVEALAALAAAHRKSLPARLVAITGSVGKTTTKEILHQLIATQTNARKTLGNFNSTIGLPIQILAMQPSDEWMICEMGMSTPGEIAQLMKITEPAIGLWTSVQAVHLAHFDSLEGIAAAKAEMVEYLPPGSTLVFNGDDPMVVKHASNFAGRKIRYSFQDGKAEVCARISAPGDWRGQPFEMRFDNQNWLRFHLPLPGRYNVHNAVAAAATAFAMGIAPQELAQPFRRIQPEKGRSQLFQFASDILLVDDSYNANPYAFSQVLRAFAGLSETSYRWLICGDMLELGPREVFFHQELGREAASMGFDRISFVGALSRFAYHAYLQQGDARGSTGGSASVPPSGTAEHFPDVSRALELLEREIPAHARIWIKASRGIHLERLAEKMIAKLDAKGGA
jgi:UDP-N-acetylmuramoyl-tripeptide--D-alanyl-D-alanine ligase